MKKIHALKISSLSWMRLTNWSPRYADWSEKAKGINRAIGCLEDFHDGKHFWGTFLTNTRGDGGRRRRQNWKKVEVGFYHDSGDVYACVENLRGKDTKTKYFSVDDVNEVLEFTINAIGVFYANGLLLPPGMPTQAKESDTE